MKRAGRTTIREVASAAGVSAQTVSRVINDRPDVSPQTRQRVQDVIAELDYRPSAIAQSLIRQRSFTLGVVTAGLRLTGPSRTLSGLTSGAEKAGYSLLLKELPHFHANNVIPIFKTLMSHQVAGIIWAVPEVGDNLKWIGDASFDLDVPVVYLTMKSRRNINVVSIDNYLGGQLAMTHLLDQGYQHIGHISGPLEWWEARMRKSAWSDGLTEAKRPAEEDCWVEGDWSPKSGAQGIEKLFQQYPEMDAVFAANDQMALGVLQYACQRDIHVPEELGVVGFDDIPESAYFWPPLSSVQQDQHSLGELAIEEIVKMIEFNNDEREAVRPKAIMVSPTLAVRQSSMRSGAEGGDR